MALTKITSTNIGANAVTNTAIGYTPANKAGDTFTGNISLTSSTTPNLYIESSNTSVNQNLWFRSNGTDTFGIEAQSNTGGAGAFLSNRSPGGGINFRTTTSGASLQTAMTIDGAGRMTLPYQPAFSAYRGSLTLPTQTWTLIVYDNCTLNRGSGYSTSTGRFTAPVAGYYFIEAIGEGGGGAFHTLLSVNGATPTGHGDSAQNWTSSNVSRQALVVNMSAGDYITASHYIDAGRTMTSNRCHFHGFFLG